MFQKNIIRLWNPFFGSSFDYLPNNSPKLLGLLDIKVLELDEEYTVDYFILYGHLFDKDMCLKKVELSFLDDTSFCFFCFYFRLLILGNL